MPRKTATKEAPPKEAPKKDEQEPDLLSGMEDAPEKSAEDEEFDLLDELSEDNGVAWQPANDEEQPRGIQGKVSYIGEIEKDAKFGGGFAPMLELTTKDDTVWSIRGYHRVLDNKIQRMLDKGLKVGDFAAFKYLGEKPGKDQDYQNYAADYRAQSSQ